MKQLFLVTFALFVIVPSALFAFGSNEDIQLQFNIDLIQGYNFTPAINEIPQYYGEHAVADLNSHAGGSYFSQENTQANYSYGVSFEPRVFIYFIGVGCNFSFQWSAEAESKVGSNSYSDEVTYSSQFFAWSIIPTVYLRPYWSVNDYFIIGFGIGNIRSAVVTGTEQRVTSGWEQYVIDDTYEASTVGYHFVFEYGYTFGALLVNVGVAFDYAKVSEFENDDGIALYNWRNNDTYKTEVLSFYFYLGFGLKI